jgi:hypothetical protein
MINKVLVTYKTVTKQATANGVNLRIRTWSTPNDAIKNYNKNIQNIPYGSYSIQMKNRQIRSENQKK